MHDLVIRNALLLDGLGNPPREGALAIAGGRIAALGDHVGPARRVLDARGLALAPGIIDIHTHFDAQLTWDPHLRPSTAARRDDRRDRQLRLHDRALPAGRTAT